MAVISALAEGWKTILVVDDDPFLSDFVRRILIRASYRCIISSEAMAGLDAAQKYRPDCILLDLSMPEIDGFAFLECKQASADIEDIPVIVLSALHRDADVQRAMKLGARGYVTKPVNDKALLTRLERIVPNPIYGQRPTTRVIWQATGAKTLI